MELWLCWPCWAQIRATAQLGIPCEGITERFYFVYNFISGSSFDYRFEQKI